MPNYDDDHKYEGEFSSQMQYDYENRRINEDELMEIVKKYLDLFDRRAALQRMAADYDSYEETYLVEKAADILTVEMDSLRKTLEENGYDLSHINR